MILELTAEQKAFQTAIEQFAREIVAQRAAGIDKSGEFPADVMHAAGAARTARRHDSRRPGAALGRDYVSYALAIEAIARASATVAVSLSVTNSLVAEVIAHAGRDPQTRAVAAAARARRGDRRLRAVGARRRHRRGEPADARRCKTATATASPARRSGSPTPRRRRWRSCSRARGPGCAARASPRFSCRWTRPGITRTARADSLGVRGLGCMDLDLDVDGRATIRCSGTSIRDSRWRCGRCRAAASRSRRRRSASARRRSTRRSPTRNSASSSASRSRTTRRSSGCSPTWRPSSTRRGC